MADEVYQTNIWCEGKAFHSFKKVLRDMGPEYQVRRLCGRRRRWCGVARWGLALDPAQCMPSWRSCHALQAPAAGPAADAWCVTPPSPVGCAAHVHELHLQGLLRRVRPARWLL